MLRLVRHLAGVFGKSYWALIFLCGGATHLLRPMFLAPYSSTYSHTAPPRFTILEGK
jgi:hypothetical protein